MNKPFIEINIGIHGIKGLLEFGQILKRFVDTSDFAKIKYVSTRDSKKPT
jgi:hypothetical protein